MDCGLANVRTVRNVCKWICFGGMFVWIVGNSYTKYSTAGHVSDEHSIGRRLLQQQGETESLALAAAASNTTSYPIDPNAECSELHSLPKHDQDLLCEFVSKVTACSGDGGFIPYFKIVYCWMPLKLLPLTMILLFIWLLYLFVFLGTTAEEYFCPSLTIIAQILHLSQNIAGVTLLAFGNGAPDIFSALAAINQPDTKRASLAFGALFGAGMFVSCVVVGAVIISKPFTLTRRPYMRDIIFYLAAVYWTFFLLWNNWIDVWLSVGFILMYLTYVCFVIFGRLIYQKWKKKRSILSRGTGDIAQPPQKQPGEEMASNTPVRTALITSDSIRGNGIHGNGDIHGNGVPTLRVTDSGREDELTHSGEIMDNALIDSKEPTNQPQPPIIKIQVEGDDDSRCSTPNERCASRASQNIYGITREISVGGQQQFLEQPRDTEARLGTSVEVHQPQPRLHTERRATTPSPRKLRKTISAALDITEDVGLTAIGTPNLSKLWHHAYRRELVHERSESFARGSPVQQGGRARSPLGPLGASSRVRSSSHRKDVPDESGYTSSDRDNEEDTLLTGTSFSRKKSIHPFVRMMLVFWPFGETFKALRIWGKIYELIKYPANCLLSITVPVIDRDEDLDNWNRWLNITQCVLAPLFICLTINVGLILIGGVLPVCALVLVAGVALATLIACTSQNDKPPKYHCVFAWLGFGVAVVWIYSIANEIVNVLQVFGVVVDISDGILGITLLAWGNSIGDAVANVTMARQGFPRMAMGACYGGPLLNMLLGIGLAATVKSVQQPHLGFSLYFTQVQMFAALFLLFSLITSLIASSILQFKMRRPYGIALFVLYLVFLLTVILAEVKVFDIKIDHVLSPF